MIKTIFSYDELKEFVRESNKIEQIYREPTEEEIIELDRFINLDVITIAELEKFVLVYQPNAKLRIEYGLNVKVANYYPPFSGPHIKDKLEELLLKYPNSNDSFHMHVEYEMLHPFTDCNGRSGRALWAHRYQSLKWGFLHMFYYQTLSYCQQFFK